MVSQEDYLEDLYGPLARFSEHKRGDMITYRDIETGLVKTGTILWVCSPARIGDRDVGLTYMVEPPGGGWPACVFPSDVVLSST